jgi:sulfur-oxidizing protein SoxZ
MAGAMQIRARMTSDNTADVKVLIAHVMEPGTRKDPKTKALIPAYFITDVVAKLNETVVITAQWGGGIAKNPFIGFKVKGAKPGDFITISAVDSKGIKYEQNAIVI